MGDQALQQEIAHLALLLSQAEVTVCLSGLGSSFQSAAQGKNTTFTTAWSRWPPLQGPKGQSTAKGRLGWRARRKHAPVWTSTGHPMVNPSSASPPRAASPHCSFGTYQKVNSSNNFSQQRKALSSVALSEITVLCKLSPCISQWQPKCLAQLDPICRALQGMGQGRQRRQKF